MYLLHDPVLVRHHDVGRRKTNRFLVYFFLLMFGHFVIVFITLNLLNSNRMPTTIDLVLCFSAHAQGLLFGNHDQKKADGHQRGC